MTREEFLTLCRDDVRLSNIEIADEIMEKLAEED